MTTDISVASPPDTLAPEIMRYCFKQTNDPMYVVHSDSINYLVLKTATLFNNTSFTVICQGIHPHTSVV